jgi:hypothetical protein
MVDQAIMLPDGAASSIASRASEVRFAGCIRQLRCKRSIIVKEPPVAFLPGIRLLNPELFAKVFANQRMPIEISRIKRIFARE